MRGTLHVVAMGTGVRLMTCQGDFGPENFSAITWVIGLNWKI